jgi:Uma2 family endonuclease
MSVDKRYFPTEIEYPESDGEPMAETDVHRDLMVDLIEGLKHHFQDDPMTYVTGNMLLYYLEGNPYVSVAPDVFVVRGVPKHRRRTYKVWEEGRAPDVVFEISSRGTWGKDLHKNPKIYAELGVREYYLFDPEYDYLEPPFLAYRLENGDYEKAAVVGGRIASPVLGLDLVDTGKTLRLLDPRTGEFLPTFEEIEAARRQAVFRAEYAESRAKDAESRAQNAESRAQNAESRLTAEAEARRKAEAELARLRDELVQHKQQS